MGVECVSRAMEQVTQKLGEVPHSSALLITILGLIIAARRSLRNWIAVQQAPTEPKVEVPRLKKTIVLLVLGVAYVGLVYLVAFHSEAYAIIIDSIVTVVQSISLVSFYAYATRGARLAVTRREGAIPRMFVLEGSVLRPRIIVSAVAAFVTLYCARTSTVNYTISAILTQLALVVQLSSAYAPAPKVSMRFVTLGFLCLEILMLTIGGGLGVYLAKSLPDVDVQPGSDISNAALMKPMQPLILSIWLSWLSLLTSTCMRFDYAVHQGKNSTTGVTIDFTDAGAAIVPKRAPRHFKMPYFTVAFTSIIATTACLAFHAPQSILGAHNDYEFALLVLLLAHPIASMAVLTLAVFRGDLKTFMAYRENWAGEAAPIALPADVEATIALPADVKADQKEEELPAYDETTAFVVVDGKK